MEANKLRYEKINNNTFVFLLNDDNTYDVSLCEARTCHIIFPEVLNNINVSSI